MCQNYKSERGCINGKRCYFPHVETEKNPNKMSTKGGAERSVARLKETICVSRDPRPGKSVLRKEGALRSNRAVKFSKDTWHKKIGKDRVHREVLSTSVGLMSVILARPSLRRGHLARRKMRPQSSMGIGENIFTSSRVRTRLRSSLLSKSRQRRRLLQNYQEREKICGRFRSFNAHSEQNGFELR